MSTADIYKILADPIAGVYKFFIVASGVFLFLYVWKKEKYLAAKIQQRFPDNKHIWYEIKHSFYSSLIFGAVLMLTVWISHNVYSIGYHPINKYGWGYYFFSIALMIFVLETWFYWTHRFLHWKPMFKWVHRVHHHSTNPTPFASYCFHPIDAFINILAFPLVIFTIPHHVSAITIFSIYALISNLIAHSGYEFFPRGANKHKIFKWKNSATHHNMHDKFSNHNYGLYFSFWDIMMKTTHPKSDQYFDGVINHREAAKTPKDAAVNTQEPAKINT